jgi:hypothetical protein
VISEKYHVDEESFIDVVGNQSWLYMTADNRSILMSKAQDALLSRIAQRASEKFESLEALSSGEVSGRTLMRLLTSRASDPSVKSLVITSPKSPEYLSSAGIEVYSSTLLEKVKQDVADSIAHSHKSASYVAMLLFILC